MSTPVLYENVYVARQPILDRRGEVWGYELLFRDGLERGAAIIPDADAATISVALSGFIGAREGVQGTSKALINFTERSLVDGLPYALPPAVAVVEVLETVRGTQEVVEAVMALKNEGYMVAVDDFEGQPGFEEILAFADVVKVDVLGKSEEQVRSILDLVAGFACLPLAEKVDNPTTHRFCMELGFALFQGFHFARPENLASRKITATEASRLAVLRELESPTLQVDSLARAVQADVGLSYRLLKFLNSSAFSFVSEIRSIRQALLMLGLKQARHWLRLVVTAELAREGTSSELPTLAILRARFLELAAAQRRDVRFPPESMFLLGLFSLLEPMLGMPISGIVTHLPIPDAHRDALCGVEGPAWSWLELTRALESADWAYADALCARIGLEPKAASAAYAEALAFAARHGEGLRG